MKNIFIVGGEGFALECMGYIERMRTQNPEIVFAGFLGESGFVPKLGNFDSLYKGAFEEYVFNENDYIVIGAGNIEIRKRIFEMAKKKNVPFFTLIDPTAVVNSNSRIGEGNIFAPFTLVSPNAETGNGNIINSYSFVAHDVKIGDFNFIAPQCQLLGHAIIENENSLGAGCILCPQSKIGNKNKIAPLSAVYKGCQNNCLLQGNPARKMGEL